MAEPVLARQMDEIKSIEVITIAGTTTTLTPYPHTTELFASGSAVDVLPATFGPTADGRLQTTILNSISMRTTGSTMTTPTSAVSVHSAVQNESNTSATSIANDTSTHAPRERHGGLSHGEKIIIGIGVPLGIISCAIIAVAVLICLKHTRANSEQERELPYNGNGEEHKPEPGMTEKADRVTNIHDLSIIRDP